MTRNLRYPYKRHTTVAKGIKEVVNGWTSWIVEKPFNNKEAAKQLVRNNI